MVCTAVFVEGQGELIFVRRLLPLLVPYQVLSFECLSVSGDRLNAVPYELRNPGASFRFTIVNVGNDERVLSAVAEREEGLLNSGYGRIIALRDMYCDAYCKLSYVIDQAVSDRLIRKHQATIDELMTDPDRIRMFFAIMELEAWLLGMYNLFSKIHPVLTCAYIEAELGFNLHDIDPQAMFFHPAVQLGNILGLVGTDYTKSEHQMESLLSHLDEGDINNAVERGRCQSFATFLNEFRSLAENLKSL